MQKGRAKPPHATSKPPQCVRQQGGAHPGRPLITGHRPPPSALWFLVSGFSISACSISAFCFLFSAFTFRRFFLAPNRAVDPKPTCEANRCNLRHVTPKTLRKALYVGFFAGGQPQHVVYFGGCRFPFPEVLLAGQVGSIYGLITVLRPQSSVPAVRGPVVSPPHFCFLVCQFQLFPCELSPFHFSCSGAPLRDFTSWVAQVHNLQSGKCPFRATPYNRVSPNTAPATQSPATSCST